MAFTLRRLTRAIPCLVPATEEARLPNDSPPATEKSSSLGSPRRYQVSAGDEIDTRQLKYGVELEHQGLTFEKTAATVAKHLGPSSQTVFRSTPYGDERRVIGPDGRTWRLDEDAGGVELVTPVLEGAHDLQLVQAMASDLRRAGGTADASAGLHVHVDAARLALGDAQKVITLMARNEHWLYPLWGVHERRRSAYCRPLAPDVVVSCTGDEAQTSAEMGARWGSKRCLGLNLQNYFAEPNDKFTVEFRYLNGTLDPSAIGCAVGFFTAVISRAMQPQPLTHEASLPGLLAELGFESTDLVARRMRGLLVEHLAKASPAPPTWRHDIEKLVDDEFFVQQLCSLLVTADAPEDIAQTALCLSKIAAQNRFVMVERSQALSQASGLAPGRALDMLRRYGEQDALAFSQMLTAAGWSLEHCNRVARHVWPAFRADARHLERALLISRRLMPYNPDGDVRRVTQLLAWPQDALVAYESLLHKSFDRPTARCLHERVCSAYDAGVDLERVAERVEKLQALFTEEPLAILNYIIEHPDSDYAAVVACTNAPAIQEMAATDRLRAAAALATWNKQEHADMVKMIQMLSWLAPVVDYHPFAVRRLMSMNLAAFDKLYTGLGDMSQAEVQGLAYDIAYLLESGKALDLPSTPVRV